MNIDQQYKELVDNVPEEWEPGIEALISGGHTREEAIDYILHGETTIKRQRHLAYMLERGQDNPENLVDPVTQERLSAFDDFLEFLSVKRLIS